MKKMKVLSVVLASAVALSAFTWANAAAFNDVPEGKYSWAVDAVNTMSQKGIIKGYEDSTFRPERTVTKLEALVLTARVLGFNDEENSAIVDAAIEAYGEKIAEYDLSYGNDEIAYLISKNVVSASELSDYIEKSNASSGMKRYEIAILLTKALDADSTVSKNVITSLEYSDAAEIPAHAKKYVEYVTNNSLMNGIEDNKFSPNTDVTRAQAAVLLYKLMNMTQYTYHSGLVASMDTASRIIKVKGIDDTLQYTVNPSVILRFEGTPITINDVATGYEAVLTLKNESLYSIDFVTPLLDQEMYASVVSTTTTGSKASISVYEISETDTTVSKDKKLSFNLTDNCVITSEGASATLKDIKSGSYVKLTVKQGKVTTIAALPKTDTVSGRIADVVITPVCKIVIELTDGDIVEYVLGDEVTVTKNGNKAEVGEVLSGDTVSVTTTYGKVTKIVATSKTQEKSGVITEVIISATPKITLKIGEETMTYKVANDCAFTIPGKPEANFYDLRAGVTATFDIESDTVVKIKTDVAEGVTQVSGTVLSVNTSYGVIQVSYVDSLSGTAITEPVFVKNKATIIDISTGNPLKISAVNTGAKITAFGSRNSGIFEATTVNVTTN